MKIYGLKQNNFFDMFFKYFRVMLKSDIWFWFVQMYNWLIFNIILQFNCFDIDFIDGCFLDFKFNGVFEKLSYKRLVMLLI